MNGWIKIHRQLEENPLWLEEKFSHGQAWVDLLMLANHKENKIFVRGNEVVTKPGELCWSILSLSRRWRWNTRTVEKFFKRLEKYEMIHYRKSNVTTIVTILKYKEYQDSTQQTTQQSTELSNTRIHTNKNDNKVNNEKNIVTSEQSSHVKQVLTVFYESVNPTISWNNNTQRQAVLELLNRFGLEKTISYAKAAVAVHGKKYAPTITTPYQLKEKLAELGAYYKRQKDQSASRVSFIS